jgi:hypothetical protein
LLTLPKGFEPLLRSRLDDREPMNSLDAVSLAASQFFISRGAPKANLELRA